MTEKGGALGSALSLCEGVPPMPGRDALFLVQFSVPGIGEASICA